MVGDVYPTNKSGNIEILRYDSARKVTVKFLDSGVIKVSRVDNVRNGTIWDGIPAIKKTYEAKTNNHIAELEQRITTLESKLEGV